jgi:hypothetical protein
MSIAPRGGCCFSNPGNATDPRQRSPKFAQDVRCLALAEGSPHDDYDVEGSGQLRENVAKSLTNQPACAVPLHCTPDFARGSDAEPRRPLGSPLKDEHQAVAADTDAAGLNLDELGALADAVFAAG